ncbi:unnamed protein product [Caenorhabditis bovis]|uniref:SAM-dependent MTase TRM10-type domain-containing protein n=1 Tax=Caenorhabditis bovis TaxID=2654633 RepID=A0A8S1F4W0_9PELO|nr:unnamed protein product [Caenorhabditis bovis]
MKIYAEIYGETPNLTDQTWKILIDMINWEDRYQYLLELRKAAAAEDLTPELEEPISKINQRRFDNGEMVYARHFHTPLDIYGSDFRNKIDAQYGANLLKQDKVPKFIVDCRFLREYSVITQARFVKQMQSLHDENWISNLPMEIHFANYRPDSQLSTIAQKNLLFCFGPPSLKGKFKPHPFAPNLTSKRVNQILPSEKLMYISPKATRYVPDVIPSEIEGVVICLSNESSPATSSTSACIMDKVQPYRIPVRKYMANDVNMGKIQLPIMAKLFRDYFNGSSIREIPRFETPSIKPGRSR